METQSKKELVPVILAIIGLIADIFGIFSVLKNSGTVPSENGKAEMLLIGLLIITYSWVAISWYFVVRMTKKEPDSSNIVYICFKIIVAVGIGLLPLLLALIFSIDLGFKATLIWAYITLIPLLSIGISFIVETIYIEKEIVSILSEEHSGLVLILIGCLFVSLIFVGITLGGKEADSNYTCVFSYNTHVMHVNKGENIAALDLYPDKMVVIDSLGNKDTIKWNYFIFILSSIILQDASSGSSSTSCENTN